MEKIVERVALALAKCVHWSECDGPAREFYRDLARTAILETLRAAREPSVAMTNAGWKARATKEQIEQHGNVHALYVAIFHAMIDQLIKEIDDDDPS